MPTPKRARIPYTARLNLISVARLTKFVDEETETSLPDNASDLLNVLVNMFSEVLTRDREGYPTDLAQAAEYLDSLSLIPKSKRVQRELVSKVGEINADAETQVAELAQRLLSSETKPAKPDVADELDELLGGESRVRLE